MRTAFLFILSGAAYLASVSPCRAETPGVDSIGQRPVAGESVSIPPDAAVFDWSNTLRLVGARVGDPDDGRFEMDCEISWPFTVRVLGVFDKTAVLRYESTKRTKELFVCRNGGVIIVSLDGWAALKRAEKEIAERKTDKARRREAVRVILNGTTPSREK